MRLIFLRHPQTRANALGYIYGKTDYPYTELGKQQCLAAIENTKYFNFDRIISSPLGRAKTLAEAISHGTHKPLSYDSKLEEMSYGILEGLTVEEGKEQYPEVMDCFLSGEQDFTIPEGETIDDFYGRVYDMIDRCIKENVDTLLVSHGGVIRTAIEYLLDVEEGFSWSLEVGNGAYIEVICEDGYHRLINMMNLPD